MAINKATLAKEIDGVIEYIYPKTSGDIVVYDDTRSVSAMISHLETDKVDKEDGKGLSTNDFTNQMLSKLNSIAENANNVSVDSALSSESTNPVQNKVIYDRFENLTSLVNSNKLANDANVTELNSRINTVDNDVRTSIATYKEAHDQDINTVNNRIEALAESIGETIDESGVGISQRISDLNDRIENVSSNLTEVINTNEASTSDRFAAVDNKFEEVNGRFDNLNRNLGDITGDISSELGNLGDSLTEAINNLNEKKEEKHTFINYVLRASNWINGVYSIESLYPSSKYLVILNKGVLTEEESEALGMANINGTTLDSTVNEFIAIGDAPTIDIPVILELVEL